MTKRKVFYSFHYDNDVFRVQQIRNMGLIDGNEPVSPNNWEEIKRQGDISIRNWIDKEISKCSCVVVLIGSQTSTREWVNYEIQQAWLQGKALLGIYIHNLQDPRTGVCPKGNSPFSKYTVTIKGKPVGLASLVRCFDPQPYDAYNDINNNLASLVEDAIVARYRLAGYRL